MSMTRRQFLAATATTAVASTLPFRFAQGQAATAKYRRVDLSTTQGQAMLDSYEIGIQRMLALPPTDSRNWYRNAFIHTLDCPHGNWWFPPWHRGYIGWFEETVRSLSGNQNFALPFWDWTAQPFVPPRFWQGLLNPANPAYIAGYDAFYAQFKDPMSAFWASLTPAQNTQLQKRGYNSVNDLWSAVNNPQAPMFFPLSQARTLTQSNPGFDAATLNAVSIETIQAAIAPTVYTGPSSVGFGFGSGIAPYHSDPNAQFSILEGQPHNNVHNNVGGFMGDFLSPVDPIFFMHHCNIDRLWDVWTRKQQSLGLPTLPTGTDLPKWQQEPFLFYIDASGNPVTANMAGDYATIGRFDYDYGPGSGDAFVKAQRAAPGAAAQKLFAGTMKKSAADSGQPAEAQVPVAAAVLEASSTGGRELFAHIIVTPPADPKGARFNVFVNPPAGQATKVSHPSFAGTVSIFGGHAHGPVEFTVAISSAVRALRAAKALKTNEPIRIQVLPERIPAATGEKLVKSSVTSVSIGAF